jgi:hypothetical protein
MEGGSKKNIEIIDGKDRDGNIGNPGSGTDRTPVQYFIFILDIKQELTVDERFAQTWAIKPMPVQNKIRI